ncbi:MAG: Calx-beta domain-containing protein [Verrucomicrobiota bacterium]
MKRLLRESPQKALERALPLDVYSALPAAIQSLVETPISGTAEYLVVPDCGVDGGRPTRMLKDQGEYLTAHVDGRRFAVSSKARLPVSGIRIGNEVVVGESPLRRLKPSELYAARRLFRPHPSAMGPPMHAYALIGDRVVGFESEENLEAWRKALTRAEASPAYRSLDPVLSLLEESPGGLLPGPEAVVRTAENAAALEGAAERSVLLIRTIFPDLDEPTAYSKEAAFSALTSASSTLYDMSYGQTSLDPEVIDEVFELPETSSYYREEDHYLQILDHAEDLALAAGYAAEDYDTVAVSFPRQSFGWGGRANIGGRDMWLNGNVSFQTMVHEFGHNYGAGHGKFRYNNGDHPGSILSGEASWAEYGDRTDIMGSGPDPEGHFSMFIKQYIGWLPDEYFREIDDVSRDGVYRLHAFDNANALEEGRVLGLKVRGSAGKIYWVGYRPRVGQSDRLRSFADGAYVLLQDAAPYDFDDLGPRASLIDVTYQTSTNFDGALAVGAEYRDPVEDVFLKVLGKGGSGDDQWLDVEVSVAEIPGGIPFDVTRWTRFEQDFTSAGSLDSLGTAWDFKSTNTGRIAIRNGSLRMDSSVESSFSRNEATLHLDLEGDSDVELQFRHRHNTSEEHSLPEVFSDSVDGNGVAVSADGVTWHRVTDFSSIEKHDRNWHEYTLDLDALIAERGIVYTSDFRIRFQQYDNYPWQEEDQDGREFDDIVVWAKPPIRHFLAEASGDSYEYSVMVVDESAGRLDFQVRRSQTHSPSEIDVMIEPLNAVAGVDYEYLERTYRFAEGEEMQPISIEIIDNLEYAPNRRFKLLGRTFVIRENDLPPVAANQSVHVNHEPDELSCDGDFWPRLGNSREIVVSGIGPARKISRVTASVYGMDSVKFDVLLRGPGGQQVMLVSDSDAHLVGDLVDLSFSKDAAGHVPDEGDLLSGNYLPTDHPPNDEDDFQDDQDLFTGDYSTDLGVFDGLSPNGTWMLFSRDDIDVSCRTVQGGWSRFLDYQPLYGGVMDETKVDCAGHRRVAIDFYY